jgi:lipopolysaccharide export LptBFGC system permease protein LptF
MLGAVAAALVKGLWRRELARTAWWRLAWPAMAAALAVAVAGLAWSGRDGRMGTYGVMVLACAVTLWWRGFGPGRR